MGSPQPFATHLFISFLFASRFKDLENVMRLAQLQTLLTSNAITTESIAEWQTRRMWTYQTQTLLSRNPHAQNVSDMAYK